MGQTWWDVKVMRNRGGKKPVLSDRDIILAFKAHRNGRTFREISDRLGVTTVTLRKWMRHYERIHAAEPPVSFEDVRAQRKGSSPKPPEAPSDPESTPEAPPKPRPAPRRAEPAEPGAPDPEALWTGVQEAIRALPTTEAARFERWIAPCRGVRMRGRRTLIVQVPTEAHETYIPDRFGPELEQVLGKGSVGLQGIEFEVESPEEP